MSEEIRYCSECGRKMFAGINMDTKEVSWVCFHCGNPCRGCPKEKDCQDTYGPDCTYERKY